MISAYIDVYQAFGNQAWLKKAEKAGDFYLHHLRERKGKLWRNAKGCKLVIHGFLDDYSLLIGAFLGLYQVTFNDDWLLMAESLCNEVIEHFSAKDEIFFNLVSDEETLVVMNSAEFSDNVIPASNSVMAHNLYMLGQILGRDLMAGRAEKMVKTMIPGVRKNPSFHAHWAELMTYLSGGPVTVQIVGNRAAETRKAFTGMYLPGVIWTGGFDGQAAGIKGPYLAEKNLIYICAGKVCYPPVETVTEALLLLVRNE
jgi:uncharacterized protein YyaL (SSP411 family)